MSMTRRTERDAPPAPCQNARAPHAVVFGRAAVVRELEHEMKLPLPSAKKVKELLEAVEEHPLGTILVTIFVTAVVYVWRH